MPRASLGDHFGYDRGSGGTIVIDAQTHANTFNYTGRASAVKRGVIEVNLTFRQTLAQSIWDYRQLVPDSNDSVRQLIQYWSDTYPSLMQK